MIGICFSISGIIFLSIFMVCFFSKNSIKSDETKLYGNLLIITFIGSLIDIFSFILYKMGVDVNSLLYTLLAKGMLVYFVAWVLIFTSYVYAISKNSIIKYRSIIFKIIFVLSSISVLSFPIDFKKTANAVYPSGLGVNLTYLIVGVFLIVSIVLTLRNITKEQVKKYIPIFLVIIMLISATLVQKVFPDSFLINFSLVTVVSVMYFTIENPDMKLLEEVHKAKVISDNANEEKTMFLYNITNEIRGITKDINYEADNILNETDNKKVDLNIVNDSAREIKGSTAKFTTMTNEILDISQVDASNIKIYNEKYSIKLILKELITKYKEICKKSGIEFRTSIASDIPEILYGDSVGLKNVMISLLDNSVKYTKKGYIELNVNVIKKQDIARLLITIEDSGIGIKSSEIDNIFNKNKEELKRNNLKNNLFTARKIITLMGGTLIASSTYGKGTTMKIVLDQKIEVIDNKYDKVYDKKKILLIEDSDTTYKLITKMLKNTNIIIDRVVLGSEGLDKIRNKEKYDLILVEEELKPLNGYDIIKKLKLIKNFNTKVVLLTKNPNIEYSYLYKDEGFSDYLIKPINRSLLLNIINKYL